jgi:hypothetical protein
MISVKPLGVIVLLLVFVSGAVSGIILFLSLNSSNLGDNEEESLDLSNQHIWYNQSGWAEAAIVAVNTGEKDVTIRKVTVRGIEAQWKDIFYWKADIGPVSSKLKHTGSELSDDLFNIDIDGSKRTFHRATSQIALESGYTIVLYIKNPGNITSSDIDAWISIAIFTENKLYYESTFVEEKMVKGSGVRLYKENLRFYGAANDLTDVTIGNSGTENTRIIRIYMGNTSTNMVQVYSDETGRLLQAGSAVTITITWPNTLADAWQPGKNYYFTIVPSPGSPLEKFPEQAPQ